MIAPQLAEKESGLRHAFTPVPSRSVALPAPRIHIPEALRPNVATTLVSGVVVVLSVHYRLREKERERERERKRKRKVL